MDIKIIISILSFLSTVIIALGSFFYVKFQTAQNKSDIDKLESDIKELRIQVDNSLSKIYCKIEASNDRVIDKLDGFKKDFVADSTCKTLRASCQHKPVG